MLPLSASAIARVNVCDTVLDLGKQLRRVGLGQHRLRGVEVDEYRRLAQRVDERDKPTRQQREIDTLRRPGSISKMVFQAQGDAQALGSEREVAQVLDRPP